MKLIWLGIIVFSLALAPFGGAMGADATGIRIATISIQHIITNCKAGKEAQKALESKADELQDKFKGEQEDLERMRKEIEMKGAVWSHDVRTEKERDYQKKLREMQLKSEDAQFEIKQLDSKVMEPILVALNEVIEEIGKKYGYTLILENSRKGIRSRVGLMYADDSLDISDMVLKEVDAKMEK